MSKKSKSRKSARKTTPQNLLTGARYGYESAATTRLNSDWVASGATADSLIRSSGDQLRNRARDLDRNNDYVISAVDKFTTKVLGEKCPVFQSRIKKQRSSTGAIELNTSLNLRIEEEFKKWQEDPASCSSNKSWDFNRILDLCVRTLMVDGEVFVRRIQMGRGRSQVKLCLELIEADNLADTYQGNRNGAPIINGIEYDEWGAPVAYWFYPYNPNDFIYGKNQNYSKSFADPTRYPADEILHLYSPRRVTQGRGVSFFAATISRLRDLVGYEQAVLVGARMRAAVMGFITSVEGEDSWGHENPNNSNAPRQYSFEPGTIQKLNENENFQLSSPQDPGPNLEGFARHQLRAFAANLGIAFSSLSGDYSQANYSSERANQIDERRGIRRVQELLKSSLLTPITDWWLDAAVLSGAIALPEKLSVRDYYCCYTWRLGGFEWVDPHKDAQAFELQLKNGMTSLQRVLAEKNIDLNSLIEERKIEQELLKEAGISVAYLEGLSNEDDAEDKDPNTEIKEGLTQIRSILDTQAAQIHQLGTVLLEASRSIAIANTAIAEIRGAADRSITVINEAPRLEPKAADDDMLPIRYSVGRKGKNCKKGKPCGGSCQSKTNVCLVGLSAEQKALALKARKAMASGGGVASELPEQDGGKLAVTSSTGAQEQPQRKTKAQSINEKYASADPSPEDAQKWLDERITSDFEINEENINRVVITEAKEATKEIVYNNAEPFRNSIVDRESFIDAVDKLHQIRNAEIDEVRGVKNSQATVEHWRKTFSVTLDPDGKTIDEVIEKNQARIDSNKIGEKAKEKARKKIAKFQAQKEDVEARSQEKAEEFRLRWLDEGGEELRRQTWGSQFDNSASVSEAKFRKTANDLNSDNVATKRRAKEDAEHKILLGSEEYGPELLGEDNITAAQSILRANYNKNGAAKKYGFQKGMSAKELKKAYKEAASKAHPDAGGSESEFIALQSAYNTALLQVKKYD